MMECPTKDVEGLVENLGRLLEEQLAAAREGNLAQVEQLGERTNGIMAQIVRCEGSACAASAARRRGLERLYRELRTILETEQADVANRLRQLRQVKRVIRAYRIDH